MAKRKNGKREPNGRLSRKAEDVESRAFEDSPAQVALQARFKHKTGVTLAGPVTKKQVKDHQLETRGSFLGKLLADKEITDIQYAAGMDYCDRYIRYASLNGIPRPTPQGAAYGEVRGGTGKDNTPAAIAAKKRHLQDNAILRCYGKHMESFVFKACVMDEPVAVAPLRLGLKALSLT